MKCPHCNIAIHVKWDSTENIQDLSTHSEDYYFFNIEFATCPNCYKLIVRLRHLLSADLNTNEILDERIIYPVFSSRNVQEEVPEPYRSEFKEASAIVSISPKASAALSRRILQNILRHELKIKKRTLASEIEEFINLPGVPAHITKAVDAVRVVGNFSAHPIKSDNTGEIVEIEPGEAEWLLDVIESLFEFVFVQPKRDEERKNKFNEKMKSLGMKPID
jgi:hypothetical protein